MIHSTTAQDDPGACPDDSIFVGVLEGTLAQARVRLLEQHVDRCPRCAGVLAQLARSGQSTVDPAPSSSSTAAIAEQGRPRLCVGRQLGRYTVLGVLGSGGMGVVYSAYDARLDRKVALKFVRGAHQQGDHKRLRDEARALARVAHPNVLTVHDIDEHEGELFVAFQYVEGMSLDRWLACKERSVAEIVDVFIRAGEGLAAAHRHNLVHRDVKSSNILIGDDGRVLVADFGLAFAMVDVSATAPCDGRSTTVRAGTPGYMAPEQLRGETVDASADQFAFCVSLYEAIASRLPFESTMPTDADLQRGPGQQPLRSLPGRLRRTLVRGLAYRREDRYPSVPALLRDLRPPVRRRRLLAAAVGLVAVGATLWVADLRGTAAQECMAAGAALQPWQSEVRDTTRDALLVSGLDYAAPVWRGLQAYLDRYARAWQREYNDACAARWEQHRQSDRVFDQRMVCLKQAALAVDDGLALIQASPPTRALQIAAALPRPKRCSETGSIASQAVESKQAQRLRVGLNRARLLAPAGEVEQAAAELLDLKTRANALGHGPLEIQATVLLAQVLARQMSPQDGLKVLEDTLLAAERSGHDPSIVKSLFMLGYYSSSIAADVPRATEYAQRARAVMARLPSSADFEVHDLSLAATIAVASGDLQAAAAKFAEVVALYSRDEDSRSNPNRWLAVANLAMVLTRTGRLDAAIEHLESSGQAAAEAVGHNHPSTLALRIRLGKAQQLASRYKEAQQTLESVRVVFERHGGDAVMEGDLYAALAQVTGNLGSLHVERDLLLYARKIKLNRFPENHPSILAADIDVADSLRRMGAVRRAVELAEQTAATLREMDHPPPDLLVVVQEGLALGYTALGRWSKAHEAVSAAEATAGLHELGPDVRCQIHLIAGELCAAQEMECAIERYERARALFTPLTDPTERALALLGLATAYIKEPAKLNEGLDLAREAELILGDVVLPGTPALRRRVQEVLNASR